MMRAYIVAKWYQGKSVLWLLLLPLSWLYRCVIAIRRLCYRSGIKRSVDFPVPIIVVGNITIGGTGKTPLTAALAMYLQQLGYKPGLVSRGYGGNASSWPQSVTALSDTALVGDEPVMLARQTQCPMVVGPDRVAAVASLLESNDCDVVISDDGLQHYALSRAVEIIVLDGARGLGNGACLPAGPLREPASRLKEVDFIVENGGAVSSLPASLSAYPMQLIPGDIFNIVNAKKIDITELMSLGVVHAVAAIGNPERFFSTLDQLKINYTRHVFPDHHLFDETDFKFTESGVIVMTEKDAVKCLNFADERYYCLPVNVDIDPLFLDHLVTQLKQE